MRRNLKIQFIIEALKEQYPSARCELNYQNSWQLMIATILSAQCTDKRVNQVTSNLFKKYPSIQAFAAAKLEDLEQDIKPTGFFRNKAKAIQQACQLILTKHQGQVPQTMNDLVSLPGIGRKTANVVMGNAFGQAEGVVVDTHMKRISRKLGLTKAETPEKIEEDLIKIVPRAEWVLFPHLIIAHGRAVCKARKPACGSCCLVSWCPGRMI